MNKKLLSDLLLILALIIGLVVQNKDLYIALSILGLVPVLISAFNALRVRQLSIDLLASIALIFSLLSNHWSSAVFINLMLSFARVFDSWTSLRTKRIIQHLLKFRPDNVEVKRSTGLVQIPVDDVQIGDLVEIQTGERIPVDGVIITGQASINQSTLTGESEPIVRKVRDQVYASTLNESGTILVRVESLSKDSRLFKIISLVEAASRQKSTSERLASKFTQWYVLATIAGSVILYALFHNFNQVLAVLLVVCADDIAVAVPLAYTAAIVKGAQLGIVIKGSSVVESLARIKYFITDKTGTLTTGKPQVVRTRYFAKITPVQFAQKLGAVSLGSHHPISVALVRHFSDKGVTFPEAESFNEIPGEGIYAYYKGVKILSGRPEFLQENGILINPSQQKIISSYRQAGLGVTALGQERELLGIVGTRDTIRSSAHDAVLKTKKLGVASWTMLTGDNEKVAAAVSSELSLDQYFASVSPEGKLSYISDFKKSHSGTLAMIGDGVNDAASLALADVSFSMGAIGSDAAIEASDVALMHDNLERIPEAMILGRLTKSTVKNIFLIWGTSNLIGLGLVFAFKLSPQQAALYNFATDFLPILYALRLSLPKFSQSQILDIPKKVSANITIAPPAAKLK